MSGEGIMKAAGNAPSSQSPSSARASRPLMADKAIMASKIASVLVRRRRLGFIYNGVYGVTAQGVSSLFVLFV